MTSARNLRNGTNIHAGVFGHYELISSELPGSGGHSGRSLCLETGMRIVTTFLVCNKHVVVRIISEAARFDYSHWHWYDITDKCHLFFSKTQVQSKCQCPIYGLTICLFQM